MYLSADPPVIIEGPGDVSAIQSQEHVMTCRARGVPDPKYEFYKVSERRGFVFQVI